MLLPSGFGLEAGCPDINSCSTAVTSADGFGFSKTTAKPFNVARQLVLLVMELHRNEF